MTGIDLRRVLTTATVRHAEARLDGLGYDPAEFLQNLYSLPELDVSRNEMLSIFSIVRDWDLAVRQRYLGEGLRIPCPHCGENQRIEKVGSGLIDRDLGLHFPTEDLVTHLAQAIPGVTWDMRNVTAAYQIHYRKKPCEIDVLACSNCNIRYANSQWKQRSISYQSDVARDGMNGLYGRANDATWVRRKAAWAGYACEVLGPIKGLEVLEVGSADGILAWQLASVGALMTGVEVNTNACNYARQVMGLEKVVTSPYARDLFPEASFDRIVSFHVIEHVPDFEAFIGAMTAHLRPGGKLLLQCPIADANRHAVSSSHPLGLTTGLLVRAFKQHDLIINSVERYREREGEARLDPDINVHWSGISPGAISIIAARL